MAHKTIRIEESIFKIVQAAATIHSRSVSGQLAHWVNIGRVLEQSPSLDMERVEAALRAEIAVDDLTDEEAAIFDERFYQTMREPTEAIKQSFADLAAENAAVGYTEE